MLELLALSAFVLAAVSAVFLALLVGRRVALARREQEFAAARARLLPLALALVEGTETVPSGQLSRRDEEVLADLLGELSRRLRGDSRVRIAAHFRGSAALRHELAALSSRRSWKRASAASRLGDMAAVSALPALREALDERGAGCPLGGGTKPRAARGRRLGAASRPGSRRRIDPARAHRARADDDRAGGIAGAR